MQEEHNTLKCQTYVFFYNIPYNERITPLVYSIVLMLLMHYKVCVTLNIHECL